MTKITIGYHTRLYGQNSVKVTGGAFGGSLDLETANRLVKHHFTVIVKQSGTPVFVDREGREVTLYITVDPGSTEAGKLAIAADRAERDNRAKIEDEKRARVNELLDGMSMDDALKLLGGA
jgi:hypothetical protein